MENDLDEGSAEYSNKFEKHRLDVEEDRLENEMGVTDCEQVQSSIIDFELPDSKESVEVHPIESNAESGKRREKLEKIELDVERDLLENKSGVTEDFSLATEDQGSEQVQSSILVSNGDAMASSSTESEFTNGHVSPVLNKNENGSTTSSDQEASDLSSLTTRKEELEQLCEVLMEERDKATGSLRERDDEVLRLRMRAVETEHEKSDLRNQLAKVQSHSKLLEKDLTSFKEENERLRAEIERLRKRIEELEAENSDLRIKLRARDEHDHADGKKTTSDSESAESAPLKAVEESVYVPSKEEDDKKHQEQEHPTIADEITTGDEVQSTEVIKSDAITESAPAASEVTVKRRETRRTSPNYYRHSFAGSLPRPFHSFELHSQHSFDHSSKHERSESIHSDTSGESESDTQAPPSIPSFMRRRLDKPYLKSGFSPVQFNYQPLPESISNRRGSWLEGVKVRSGSLTRAHENSSDSESSGVSGTNVSASVEDPRECEREQVASTLSSAPEEIEGVHGRGDASETEKYGRSFKLHSQPPEYAENASELKHFTDEGRESETKVVQENDEAHEEEKEKSENVSDLVDLWNSRTEVYDI